MLEQIKKIVAENLNVEEDAITLESSFKEDLKADSLDLFEMVMALEEEFDMEIPSEDLEQLETVQDVVNYIETLSKKVVSGKKGRAYAYKNHGFTGNSIPDYPRAAWPGWRSTSGGSRVRGGGPWYHRRGQRPGGMGAGTDPGDQEAHR